MATAATRPQVIRKIRHWKQRFDPKAKMVWRKRVRWPTRNRKGLQTFKPGEEVPDWVIASMGGNKLRNLWESGRIELLGFEAPTPSGQAPVEAAPEPQLEQPQVEQPQVKKKTTRRKKAATKPASQETT